MQLKPPYMPLQWFAFALALFSLNAAAAPVDIDGVIFEDHETVANTRLVRNGATASTLLSSKATAVGLYMSQRQGSAEAAFAQKGPKRIRVVTLREISARDLATVLLDRIKQNTTREDIENNVLQLAALGGAFSKLNKLAKGDVITLDWIPQGALTEIRINSELVTPPIQGEQFFPVVMKVWLGPKVRPLTRNNLLGASEAAVPLATPSAVASAPAQSR